MTNKKLSDDEKIVLWWIRRDLRLSDNKALASAMNNARQVIPVFVVDPYFLTSPYVGEKRRAFLWEGLRQLDASLRQRGSYLVIRHGLPDDQLLRLCEETHATAIYAEEDFSSYALRRGRKISSLMNLILVQGLSAIHPGQVYKADGSPYTVYTPFMRAWKTKYLSQGGDTLSAPDNIHTPSGIHGEALPTEKVSTKDFGWQAGEQEGQHILQMYIQGEQAPIYRYEEQRNFMEEEGTSRLSPYLRFGMLSANQAVLAALSAMANARTQEAYQSAEIWLNELIWREFYLSILYHYPFVQHDSFKPEFRKIAWRNDPWEFEAWCAGQTGYPIVDAAMRQLNQTGWMHNRGRMIVASFLVKDLLIDWRWGERWFMQQLIDGDPASNNGGWQWTAGTGTDAAPYFRIFNPVLQSQKFDPQGRYIRHWVPELRSVPLEYIHQPWKMPSELQHWIGCEIGKNYPEPIVDHKQAREWTLAAYGKKP